MLTTFTLSNVIRVQMVLGVTHALYSPLTRVTNIISESTTLEETTYLPIVLHLVS